MGECFFWYWLTRVVLDKIQRAVKRLCVCGYHFVILMHYISIIVTLTIHTMFQTSKPLVFAITLPNLLINLKYTRETCSSVNLQQSSIHAAHHMQISDLYTCSSIIPWTSTATFQFWLGIPCSVSCTYPFHF